MAEYKDLYSLRSNDTLRNKVAVVTIIAAESLLSGSPTFGEASWASKVVRNPNSEAAAISQLDRRSNITAFVRGV